jgi:hypothetical protein
MEKTCFNIQHAQAAKQARQLIKLRLQYAFCNVTQPFYRTLLLFQQAQAAKQARHLTMLCLQH